MTRSRAACNEGFLREDAILVVTFITDEDDDPTDSTGDAMSHDFATGAEAAPRLREFVGMWGDRGHIGSICATDYAPFFASATDSIGIACDELVPQG